MYPSDFVAERVHREVDTFLDRMDTLVTKTKVPTFERALAADDAKKAKRTKKLGSGLLTGRGEDRG